MHPALEKKFSSLTSTNLRQFKEVYRYGKKCQSDIVTLCTALYYTESRFLLFLLIDVLTIYYITFILLNY